MKKSHYSVLIIICILIGAFFVLNNYIYREKQGGDTIIELYRASFEGVYVCLKERSSVGRAEEVPCEPAIRTSTDEDYAVNFGLMSQMHAPLEEGQRFSAWGVVTPIERLSTTEWQKYGVKGIFSVTDSLQLIGDEDEPYACTADAKLCPDGSYVGREGPQCEFVPCPETETGQIEVTARLGDESKAFNLTLSPQEVISDSRCPVDVTCIWAGTVEVRISIATEVAHGELVLKLGEPQTFDRYSVTLVDVLPRKTQEYVSDDIYELVYLVRVL